MITISLVNLTLTWVAFGLFGLIVGTTAAIMGMRAGVKKVLEAEKKGTA